MSGARYAVGSTMSPKCNGRYPVGFVAVDVKSATTRMSEKSYELHCKMFAAATNITKDKVQ